MMVQAAHFTNLDYLAFGGGLHPSVSRGVIGERLMSSAVMVLWKLGRERSMQRAFAEDDDMIQASAANSTQSAVRCTPFATETAAPIAIA